MRVLLGLLFLLGTMSFAEAAEFRAISGGKVRVEKMQAHLMEPWAFAFLPDGLMLITERDGFLYLAEGQRRKELSGVPKVYAKGQGGLLDVVVARDFARTREIFLSFAEPRGNKAATALAVARLNDSNTGLENLRVIFRQSEPSSGGRHFGSRIVEARDGTLFLTIGDRGKRALAQDLGTHNGKLIRVNRDGSVPADNPFAKRGPRPEIFSYGHRNAQGAALDSAGNIWTVEHGAKGGDEVNQPRPGKNYGWPRIAYGRHYSGLKIGEGTHKPGMEQPAHYWDPSIAPSGMMVYSGKLWPQWKGDIFVGSLKFDLISRLSVTGAKVQEEEYLFNGIYERIRDIREAPDGSIWFLSVGDGALYRFTPDQAK